MLIWTAKTVEQAIIKAEILEYWHYFKVYRILLEKYLIERGMELLKQKIESSTKI